MPPEAFHEWEVVWKKEVMVRQGRNFSSEILGTRRPGDIVVGEAQGWHSAQSPL